jgi:competence protein ComEC
MILDRGFLRSHGASAIRFGPEGPIITSARRPGEAVPWRVPATEPASTTKSALEIAQPRTEPGPDDADVSDADPGDAAQ